MSRCFQLSAVWLSAAETPLGQGRPGCGNHLAIGPAAQGAWCGGTNRSHSKTNGPNIDMTQVQPRTPREVLRGERPKWLFVHFGHSKWTPAERPHQDGDILLRNRRRENSLLSRGRKQEYNNGLPWTSTAGHRIVNVSGGCKPQPYGGWARCRWNRCSHQPRPGGRRG